MGRIQLLPPHLINRIAAGEVVERPASVIKELVENAIDAGATRIDIAASNGGRALRVADNGCGMGPDDAQLAFLNHATSKITHETDLEAIKTLGFRGEALASIAAISRLTCLTRTAEADAGCAVRLDNDGNPTVTATGCATGTIIEVDDLFYNTPARLKFLKKPATELAAIEELVQHLALSHPHIRFTLILQEKSTLKTSGSGQLATVLDEIFGLGNDLKKMIPVTFEDTGLDYTLNGLISTPDMLKHNRKWLITFVNGRLVKDAVLTKAIESAYESLVPHGKFPFCVLFVSLPPGDVDVNVHPTKREVRFASGNGMFGFIRGGLLRALEAHGCRVYHTPDSLDDRLTHAHTPLARGPLEVRRAGFTHSQMPASPTFPGANTGGPTIRRTIPGESLSQQALAFYEPAGTADPNLDLEMQPKQPKPLRVIGQLFNTYILIESPQGLMVVDQHIASERAFFEALSNNILVEAPETQQLIASPGLAISPSQRALLTEHQPDFQKMGFDYALGEGTVTLTGAPMIYLNRHKPEKLFEQVLAGFEETGEGKIDVELMIATMACHSAVRAGDVLDHRQMAVIIDDWLACKLPWTCPHGRPIAHTIQASELNTFFDRPSMPVNAGIH